MMNPIVRILTKTVCSGAALALFLLVCGTAPAGAQTAGNFKMDAFGSGPMHYEASGTVYFESKGQKLMKAIFKDNVTMKMQNMTLRCDNLVFVPSTSPTSVTLLRALGNPVKIEQEGVKAVCKKFEYFPEQKKTVFSGDAVIEMMLEGKPNTVTGKTITVIQMPDGTLQFLTSGPSSGNLSSGFSGMNTKTEGQEESPGKGGTGSGKKDNKPAAEDSRTSGTAPLEKITDKAADENP